MIDAIKTWLRENDSMSHVVVGSIVFFPMWLILAAIGIANAHWIAAFTVIGGYYGRERRDYEVKTGRPLNQVSFEIGGYFPWNWNGDQKRDFGYPLLGFLIFAGIIQYFV